MPNLIENAWFNKSDAVKNKLIVVGGFSKPKCEVHDKSYKKFGPL